MRYPKTGTTLTLALAMLLIATPITGAGKYNQVVDIGTTTPAVSSHRRSP